MLQEVWVKNNSYNKRADKRNPTEPRTKIGKGDKL